MTKIAHIINPVKAGSQSDLHTAQPITFETMRLAKEFAKSSVEVELFTTQYEEDREIIPDYFKMLPDLNRSVLDINNFHKSRKLPLIKDILDKVYHSSDAEYFIYTNVDIAVMPQFYSAINKYLTSGHDTLIINRRRVPKIYNSLQDIPLLLSDIGKPHPGFDCFVFHRDLYPMFILGNICVGINFIGVTLAHNLFAHSKNLKLIDNKHLTIHIGLEVMPQQDKEYRHHNQGEFNKIFKQLKPHLDPIRLPYSQLPFYKKILKWGLNPSVFIVPSTEIEIKGWWNRIKYKLNEIRFSWLNKD